MELKDRVLGTYGDTELCFELSGNSIKRPKGIDKQNCGIVEALDLRNLGGLRHGSRADRDKHREYSDQMAHRARDVFHGAKLVCSNYKV